MFPADLLVGATANLPPQKRNFITIQHACVTDSFCFVCTRKRGKSIKKIYMDFHLKDILDEAN